MANVCVLIPVYTPQLSEAEWASLDQVCRVLASFDIILYGPSNQDFSSLFAKHSNLKWHPERPEYFVSVAAYNHLLLSKYFYEQFSAYEYMLIYQLDAWVFSDQLSKWCQSGFDYVGAPWFYPQHWYRKLPKILFHFIQNLAIRCNLKIDENTPRMFQFYDKVGNGGFSLRRISAFLQVIDEMPDKIEFYKNKTSYYFNEDVFWGVEANRHKNRLKLPSFKEALSFSFEFSPQESFIENRNELPFGCHAWQRYDADFWKPYIKY